MLFELCIFFSNPYYYNLHPLCWKVKARSTFHKYLWTNMMNRTLSSMDDILRTNPGKRAWTSDLEHKGMPCDGWLIFGRNIKGFPLIQLDCISQVWTAFSDCRIIFCKQTVFSVLCQFINSTNKRMNHFWMQTIRTFLIGCTCSSLNPFASIWWCLFMLVCICLCLRMFDKCGPSLTLKLHIGVESTPLKKQTQITHSGNLCSALH